MISVSVRVSISAPQLRARVPLTLTLTLTVALFVSFIATVVANKDEHKRQFYSTIQTLRTTMIYLIINYWRINAIITYRQPLFATAKCAIGLCNGPSVRPQRCVGPFRRRRHALKEKRSHAGDRFPAGPSRGTLSTVTFEP